MRTTRRSQQADSQSSRVGRTSIPKRAARGSHRVNEMPHLKIFAGGQTGADRAALDWARRRRIPHGGWCPKGRLAEDGVIDREYRLQETPSASYAERTEWNIRDSHGTVIFSVSEALAGGTLLAANVARRLKKPLLHLCPSANPADAAKRLKAFVARHKITVLNVAGPRATEESQITRFVEQTLEQAFGDTPI